MKTPAVLLSAIALAGQLTATAAPAPLEDCLTLTSPTCYSPQQFRAAYGIAPLVDRGIDGRGETVVLPEFAPAAPGAGVTDVRADLSRYDELFGLPGARLEVLTRFAGAASPDLSLSEEAGDVEIVHAIAPQATIKVVLVSADVLRSGAAATASGYATALRFAANEGSVVASTAAWAESCFTTAELASMHAALLAARERRVTVVVSSGDSGAAGGPCPGASSYAPAKGVDYPAADPLALAVGGTRLDASHATGAYLGETAWNLPIPSAPAWASTGGFSSVFPRPTYQAGTGAGRGVPDVAADASPDSGIAIAVAEGQNYVIGSGAGTSAAAPCWAGLVALADQYAGRDLGFVDPAIYRIGNSAAFHDIRQGTNTLTFPNGTTVTGYPAAPGWDPVTGWGSPDAAALIPLLAAEHPMR